MSIENPSTNKENNLEEGKTEQLSYEKQESKIFDEFNVPLKDLKEIEGFEELSHGQRILVAENLKQLTLGRIHEEAVDKHEQDISGASFLGKVWQNISKKYQIEKIKKTTSKDIVSGGMDIHKETITHLVGRAGDGPDVEVESDGSLKMLYISNIENSTPEQKESIKNFNNIASNFSRMPEEWRYETSSKKEQKNYKELREQYEKAKISILEIKRSETGEKDATLYMNNIDSRIYGEQFINTHPDVETQLKNITDKNIWIHAMSNVVAERGIYSAAGFITRSITTSFLGLAGAPIAASLLGGFRARKRAHEVLIEHEKNSRIGKEDSTKEAKNFVDANQMREKLESIVQKINIEDDSEKKEKLITSLKARISYTQGKMEDGLVNYGKGVERLGSQYELNSSLGSAVVAEGINKEEKSELEERMKSFLDFKEDKISNIQKKYLNKQMIRGAAMGAGFAVAGYALRQFGEEWFGWGDKSTVDTVKATSIHNIIHDEKITPQEITAIQSQNQAGIITNDDGTQAEMLMEQTHGMGGSQADMLDAQLADNSVNGSLLAHEKIAEVAGMGAKESASLLHEKIAENIVGHSTIEKGGSVWDSAKSMVKNPHDFNEAWKNSMVKIPGHDGLVHISEVNLVHPGTVVEYVKGVGTASGHFEIVAPEGHTLPDIKAQTAFTEVISGAGAEKISPEVLIETDRVMQKKIEDIYKYKFLFFSGSQIGEWNGNPADGVIGIKDMPVDKILKGDFGEPFWGGMDAAQGNNRDQLLKFLKELDVKVKPISGETTEEYIKRAMAIQISNTEHGAKMVDVKTMSSIGVDDNIINNSVDKSIKIENIDVRSEVVDGVVKNEVIVTGDVKGYSGTEILSKDYLNRLSINSENTSLVRGDIRSISRSLSLRLAAYDQLKSEGLDTKAEILLKNIHSEVTSYDKKFGSGVIDHSKIPVLK